MLGTYPSLAQSGGQFCARSFQDTNGNGLLDAETEQLLTRGVGLELLNADNVVIASAILERSPNADDGIVCFQNLADDTYALLFSSADYNATTPRLAERTVSASGLPVVVEFGAQRIGSGAQAANNAPATGLAQLSPEQRESLILRVSLATIGTVVIMLLMLLIGVGIYLLMRSRQSPQPQPAGYARSVAGQSRFQPYDAPPPAETDTTPTLTDSTADTGKVQTVSDDDLS